jgi:hypothetical protein
MSPAAAALVTWVAAGAAAGPRLEAELAVGRGTIVDLARAPGSARYFSGPSAEVPRELDRVVESLRRWYRALPATRRAAPDFAFPPTTPFTPPHSRCRAPGGLYRETDAAWHHPSWTAIGFRPAAGHRFQYRLISIGHGREASFSVHAQAELDCRGRVSLYRLSGHARGGEVLTTILRMRRPAEGL